VIVGRKLQNRKRKLLIVNAFCFDVAGGELHKALSSFSLFLQIFILNVCIIASYSYFSLHKFTSHEKVGKAISPLNSPLLNEILFE